MVVRSDLRPVPNISSGALLKEKDIVTWLDELSGYLNGCIEFFNDVDEIYPKDYIYVRSINDDGTATLGECWSYVGQITKASFRILRLFLWLAGSILG